MSATKKIDPLQLQSGFHSASAPAAAAASISISASARALGWSCSYYHFTPALEINFNVLLDYCFNVFLWWICWNQVKCVICFLIQYLLWVCWFGFVVCFKQAVWKPLVDAFATMCGLVVPIALAHAWCAFSLLVQEARKTLTLKFT